MIKAITTEEAEKTEVRNIFGKLESSEKGLSTSEAEQRRSQFGFNEISEKKISPVVEFLGYFWGPIPWMIEVAAILSLLVRHWADLTIIVVLLIFNGLVGFWQEYQAGNAVEALKKQLALKTRVLRDETWQEIDARELVPGDVIRIRLGDIIPADTNLMVYRHFDMETRRHQAFLFRVKQFINPQAVH